MKCPVNTTKRRAALLANTLPEALPNYVNILLNNQTFDPSKLGKNAITPTLTIMALMNDVRISLRACATSARRPRINPAPVFRRRKPAPVIFHEENSRYYERAACTRKLYGTYRQSFLAVTQSLELVVLKSGRKAGKSRKVFIYEKNL